MTKTQQNRPFAVFDIDGTVIRWQLYHAISDALAQKGIIDPRAFQQVKKARMNWKRRAGEASYHNYEQTLVAVFEQALHGLDVHDFNTAADEVFEEYKDQVYTYTRDLIHSLKAKHYILFALSGSPANIVEKLVHYYGFDDFAASHYQQYRGRFTGTTELSIGKKAQLLQELMEKHQVTPVGSFGVGDSEGDIDMLNMVEQPIAFNPSSQLMNYATEHHWAIVVERKNVIYALRYRHGNYQLTI